MVKKLLIFFSLLAVVGGNFLFIESAGATSIHDNPWCNLVFWRDGYCDDDDDDKSPSTSSEQATPQNQAPVWTTGQTVFNVTAGNLLQLTVSAYDPNNDPVTYGVSFLPIGASFNGTNQTFSWTPNSNQTGTYMVQFSAYDGKTYAYQGITINVTAANNTTTAASTNRKPVWTPISDKTVTVNQKIEFSVLATDADGDMVHYTLLNWPAGGNFHAASRTFSWTPNGNQVGSHVVSFRASDDKDYADMGVVVVVSAAPASAPTLTLATPTIKPNPAPVPVKLKISDIKFANENGNIIISWKTTIPARSRVIYDIASQADRTGNFTYANATPDGTVLETEHQVNLGKLQVGTVYYLRAVSKNNGQTAISQEIAFLQLENGNVSTFLGASLFSILGSLFANASFLWIIIFALAVFLFFLYKKVQKLSAPL